MKRPIISKERLRFERRAVAELKDAGLPADLAEKVRDCLRRARIPHGTAADLAAVAALRQGEKEGYGMLLRALKEGRLCFV